jgi:hypothetical protein
MPTWQIRLKAWPPHDVTRLEVGNVAISIETKNDKFCRPYADCHGPALEKRVDKWGDRGPLCRNNESS